MDVQRKLEILADANLVRGLLGRKRCDPSPHLLDSARLKERFKAKAAQLGFGF